MDDGKKNPYSAALKAYKEYFSSYGGYKAVASSPYFHGAVALYCISILGGDVYLWPAEAMEVIPNLLGFTLGGYAIFLSFGNDEFRIAISGKRNGKSSPLNEFNTTFLHFIIMQGSCVIVSIISIMSQNLSILYKIESCFDTKFPTFLFQISFSISFILNSISNIVFFYSLFLVLASAITIYRLVRAFDKAHDEKSTEQ
jgi:hypothetical protein